MASAFVTLWPSCTVSLLGQPPEARPPSQGSLTRRPRTDLRPLTELHLPAGILLGPVGFVTHSQFCQPVSQTKATVSGTLAPSPASLTSVLPSTHTYTQRNKAISKRIVCCVKEGGVHSFSQSVCAAVYRARSRQPREAFLALTRPPVRAVKERKAMPRPGGAGGAVVAL